jgi:hypothetical protein
MFLFLSTGLATLRYGDGFLPTKVHRFQQHEGWPGHELPARGLGRLVGISFGVALLTLDLLVLVGLIIEAALRSELAVVIYVLEFSIVVAWTILLWRWIRRHQRARGPAPNRLSE